MRRWFMSQTFLKHIICEGERWDTLSFKYYGNAFEYSRIMNANPHIGFCEVLPVGAVVFIPVIHQKPTNNTKMPPWLRGNQ